MNTDNHPYLEFTPAMAYFVSSVYRVENTVTVRDLRESVFPLLVNVGESDEEIAAVAAKIQRRFEAMRHSITGDMLHFVGMPDEAAVEYSTALRIDPEEKNWLNPIWQRDRPPNLK